MERNVTLDRLKGLAAFLVVLGHAISAVYRTDYQENMTFKIIYSFHMPLFMFISGYLSFGKMTDIRDFLTKRFMGLIIPYLAWSPLDFINRTLSGLITISYANMLMSSLVFPRSGSWFLYVLFINLILLAACKKLSDYLGDLTFLLMAGFMLLVPHLLHGATYFGIDMVSGLFLYVSLGYLIAKNKDKLLIGKPLIGVSLLLFPFLFYFRISFVTWETELLNHYGSPGDGLAATLYTVIVALCGICMSYYLVDKILRLSFLETLGRNSLVCFTTHGIFLLTPIFDGIMRVFAITIIGVVVPSLIAKSIGQSKLLKLIFAGKGEFNTRRATLEGVAR